VWLEQTGGKVFHATDCEREEGGPELYKALTQIVANSRLGAYGAALDLGAFRKWFPEIQLDTFYYNCFMRVVYWMTNNAVNRLNETIEFTFHHRKQSEFNAGMLYNAIVNMPEWEANVFMSNKVSFDSDENPRIQMADLIARETMKALDNQLTGVPPRKSMLALFGKGKRGAIHILGEDFCAGWRAEVDSSKVGEEYVAWLDKNRLQDSVSSRIRYMTVINALGLDSKKPV
jgi:hypothetical protein